MEELRIPLSNQALELNSDIVNWKSISQSHIYKKDENFIRLFNDKLDWENIYNVSLNPEVASHLTFEERLIPFNTFISLYGASNRLQENVINNLQFIASSKENMTAYMKTFGPKQTEDTFSALTSNIDPYHFADLCCSHQYIPTSKPFIDILKRAYRGGDWVEFMVSCKPNFAFIEEHIVPGASKDAWLNFVSKHSRKRYSLEIRHAP